MKKIILLVVITLFMTGCSVEYNVSIDDVVNEEILINDYLDRNVPAFIDEQGASESNEIVEGVEYYDLQYNGVLTSYKYDFSFNDYSKSRAANTCLESVKLNKFNNQYILNTSSYYSCMDYYTDIENIDINISFNSNYVIVSHNADIENNNVLSWNINRSNYTNKYIQVIFKDKNEEKEPIQSETPGSSDEDEGNNKTSPLVIILLIGVFISFISLAFYFKITKSQRG